MGFTMVLVILYINGLSYFGKFKGTTLHGSFDLAEFLLEHETLISWDFIIILLNFYQASVVIINL